MYGDDDRDRGEPVNPHSAAFRNHRLSGDEMQDRIDDGYYEDDPPEDQPGWYKRGRKKK